MTPLIYDLEIVKAIPDSKVPPLEGIEYCAGWHDHQDMGVACICAYDYSEERYRVFTAGNYAEFFDLAKERSPLVGFNNIPFDNRVINAVLGGPLPEEKCYDLLREIWAAVGLGPEFRFGTHNGYGLDAVCRANDIGAKTGTGAMAPVWWQQKLYGRVIDYCLSDVRLTKLLFELAVENRVRSPKTGQPLLNMSEAATRWGSPPKRAPVLHLA